MKAVKKTSVRAIIFDLDGVIVDTEPLSLQHEREFLLKLGATPRPLRINLQGLNARAYWGALQEAYGLSKTVEELVALWRPSYMEFLDSLGQIPVMAGVEDLIKQLAATDYLLAIGSSANPKRIELILRKTGLKEYFSVIISGDDITQSKPHPEAFLLAAERLAVAPADCAVIEDSTNGVLAAKAAGMYCIGYAGSSHNSDDLSAADLIIKDFAELENHFSADPTGT